MLMHFQLFMRERVIHLFLPLILSCIITQLGFGKKNDTTLSYRINPQTIYPE